ncbi:MAG: flavodoxin family protein [Oscillospiraceae bacterium]
MKNILIISTSLRNDSNSQHLASEFEKGAKAKGHNVQLITLKNKSIKFCQGCLSCQKTNKCIIKDDTNEICEKIKNADILVFATPIYYYEMCGQMKTLLDRCNPIFSTNYNFRDVYLIATAADNNKSAMDGAIKGMQGWIDCFEKAVLKDVIYGIDLMGSNEAKAHQQLLQEVYELAYNI